VKMAKKVLIIDDDVEYVEAIANLLDAKGYDVTSASNGKDGVKQAKEQKPDLILLDVMMTTKSEGFDVARNSTRTQASGIRPSSWSPG
jgi:DNA-binding response OmpR family regulator